MRQTWIRPIELVVLPALDGRIRVLGFTSPDHGAGVTSVARAAAETIARSGVRTLLLDLTTAAGKSDSAPNGWTPGAQSAAAGAQADAAGYDVLIAQPTTEARFLFNDAKRLRQTLSDELAGYAVIVVDLPPLLESSAESINPVAAALACDRVLMVYAKGLTRRVDMTAAGDLAKASGIKLEGLVYNEHGEPSLGKELAAKVARLTPKWPRLFGWLERTLLQSPILR